METPPHPVAHCSPNNMTARRPSASCLHTQGLWGGNAPSPSLPSPTQPAWMDAEAVTVSWANQPPGGVFVLEKPRLCALLTYFTHFPRSPVTFTLSTPSESKIHPWTPFHMLQEAQQRRGKTGWQTQTGKAATFRGDEGSEDQRGPGWVRWKLGRKQNRRENPVHGPVPKS